jgi:hypothetical protein
MKFFTGFLYYFGSIIVELLLLIPERDKLGDSL